MPESPHQTLGNTYDVALQVRIKGIEFTLMGRIEADDWILLLDAQAIGKTQLPMDHPGLGLENLSVNHLSSIQDVVGKDKVSNLDALKNMLKRISVSDVWLIRDRKEKATVVHLLLKIDLKDTLKSEDGSIELSFLSLELTFGLPEKINEDNNKITDSDKIREHYQGKVDGVRSDYLDAQATARQLRKGPETLQAYDRALEAMKQGEVSVENAAKALKQHAANDSAVQNAISGMRGFEERLQRVKQVEKKLDSKNWKQQNEWKALTDIEKQQLEEERKEVLSNS